MRIWALEGQAGVDEDTFEKNMGIQYSMAIKIIIKSIMMTKMSL